MSETRRDTIRDEDRLTEELQRFGWTCGPDFFARYYSDAWVFNLANALLAVVKERDEARAVLRGEDT
jgi:hypothetical protein